MMRTVAPVVLLAAMGCLCPLPANADNGWTPQTFDCWKLDLRPPPSGRIALEGFSILAPRGPKWCLFKQDGRLILFTAFSFLGVRLEQPPLRDELAHTFEAQAERAVVKERRVDTPAALLAFAQDWVKAGFAIEPGNPLVLRTQPDPRFSMRISSVAAEKVQGADCVRYSGVEEEANNPRSPTGAFTIEVPDGLLCLIPGVPAGLAWIGYSERYPKGLDPRPRVAETLKTQITDFMQSLKFGAAP